MFRWKSMYHTVLMSGSNLTSVIDAQTIPKYRVLTGAKKTLNAISIHLKSHKHSHIFTKIPSSLFQLIPHILLIFISTYGRYTDKVVGDEIRYIAHSKMYFSDLNNIELLWNGPFYPIILKCLGLISESKLLAVSLNFVLLVGTVILMYQTIRNAVSSRVAYWVSLVFAVYTFMCPAFSRALTEATAVFLFTAIICLSLSLLKQFKTSHFILLTISSTALCLTKIIFGYIFLAYAAVFIIVYIIKQHKNFLILSSAFVLSIVLCVPYLIHTYNLTSKVYYWGTAGGLQLYWMTTLNPHEYGDWNNETLTVECFSGNIFCNQEFWAKTHEPIMQEVRKFSQANNMVEMDTYLKTKAIANIKKSPVKYIKNIIANIGRMVFGYPFSYTFQTMGGLFRIIINALFVFPFLIAIGLVVWQRFPRSELTMLLLILGYIGASSLVSAYPRQLFPVVPAILLFLSFILGKSIRIQPITVEEHSSAVQ